MNSKTLKYEGAINATIPPLLNNGINGTDIVTRFQKSKEMFIPAQCGCGGPLAEYLLEILTSTGPTTALLCTNCHRWAEVTT